MLMQSTEILADKHCHACATGLLGRDRFCRHCGVRQMDVNTAETNLACVSECVTKPLGEQTEELHSYSGQMIRMVTQGLSPRTATQNPGRGLRWLVCTLITFPIWMLIVLLSPLDAYTAAKAAAGNMTYR